MKNKIHFNTIKKYFAENYGIEISENGFVNNKTGAVYNVICKKDTDIAVFTERDNGSFICIDSNGDAVDRNNIFGYVNGPDKSSDEYGMIVSEDKLVLHIKNEPIDIQKISEIERQLYPERTSIVLTAMMRGCHNETEFTSFYVDEVKYVSKEEFDEIRQGLCSDVLEKYSEKRYGYISDGMHGILVIGENGDGILVNTDGTDYARYMSYAPQIEAGITNMLETEMEQRAIYEMKLYVPLRIVERGIELDKHYDVDGEAYFNKIQDTVRKDDICEEKRGFAAFFRDNKINQNKVYSIKPDVEKVNDMIMGVVVIKMTEPLNQAEVDEMKEYITAQFANGWGDSFEQQAIYADGKEVYVHFWNKEEYFIKTEEELFMEQEQDMGMQGILGMSGMQ